MALVGSSITVRGEIHSTEDLVIEGRIDGPVWSDGQSVTVAPAAVVIGDIVARQIIVQGHVAGTMVASTFIDIRPSGRVTGRALAPSFALRDGATFNGRVEPQHLEAALSVARHRRAELGDKSSR